jgi:hypothetical protein
MDLLTDEEFRQTAYPALLRLFVCDDPYDAPFAPDVSVRWILFRYNYRLTSSEVTWPLRETIMRYAQRHAEVGFYYSILGRPTAEGGISVYRTWFVPFTELDVYHRLVEPLENIIYSPGGRWGILCSDESHGLLGGRCGSRTLPDAVDARTRAPGARVHRQLAGVSRRLRCGDHLVAAPAASRVWRCARAGVDHGVSSGGLRQ